MPPAAQMAAAAAAMQQAGAAGRMGKLRVHLRKLALSVGDANANIYELDASPNSFMCGVSRGGPEV